MTGSELPNAHDFVASLFAALRSVPTAAGAASGHHLQAAPTAAASRGHPSDLPVPASALDSPGLKPILITLHCLFPHTFLPALNVLDRRLIVRSAAPPDGRSDPPRADRAYNDGAHSNTTHTPSGLVKHSTNYPTSSNGSRPQGGVYWVRSSQRSGRRTGGRAAPTDERADNDGDDDDDGDEAVSYHEVRLGAWNCTCAAFALAALADHAEPPTLDDRSQISHVGASAKRGHNHVTESPLDHPPKTQQDWPVLGGLRLKGEGAPPVCKHLLACFLVEEWPLVAQTRPSRLMDVDEITGWAAGWR